MKGRKKPAWGLLIALFTIPLVILFFVISQNQDSAPGKGTVQRITLYPGEEKKTVEEREDIRFFVEAASSGSAIEKPAKDLSFYRAVRVVFHKLDHDVEYIFYLSDSEIDCVYRDSEGKFFLFPSEVALSLHSHPLLEDYGLSFASHPTAQWKAGERSFLPAETAGDWHYVRTNGQVLERKVSEGGGETAVLSAGTKPEIAFSIKPDYCNVLLVDSKGKELFFGNYSEMGEIRLEKEENLSCTVSCRWYQSEGADYFGDLTYSFWVFYDIPASCTSEKSEAKPGESFLLTVKHSQSTEIAVGLSFAGNFQVSGADSEGVRTILVTVGEQALPGQFSVMIWGSDLEISVPVTVLPPSAQ